MGDSSSTDLLAEFTQEELNYTPLQAWNLYTKNLVSPQGYIDFGFYAMIAAALQRRVWFFDAQPIFPNLYTILVGRPSIGKGMVLSRILDLMTFHRDPKRPKFVTSLGPEDGYLFPNGADTATFEQVCDELAESVVTAMWTDDAGNDKPLAACSLLFVLTEMSSLFRKHHDQIMKLMLKAYDCEPKYDYKLKNGKSAMIRNPCLNFIAGTQVDFLQECYEQGIFSQGFASRALFVFEHNKRHHRFHQESSPRENALARMILLAHIKDLSQISGPLIYTDDCIDYIEACSEEFGKREETAGKRMQGYFGRKTIHLFKLACAVHFSYSLSKTITLADLQTAYRLLHETETKMEAGLNIIGRNKQSAISRDVFNCIANMGESGIAAPTLAAAFASDLTFTELEVILAELDTQQLITWKFVDSNKLYFKR